MKIQIFALLCAIVLVSATTTNAQTKPIPPDKPVTGFRFGIGLEGALPMGDMNDVYNYKAGAGATLRFSKGIAENLDLLLTSGAIGFMLKDEVDKTLATKIPIFIPVKLGARFMIDDKLYIMGEAGITFTKTYGIKSWSITNENITTTKGTVNGSNFCYAPSFGFRFGGLDLGLRYDRVVSRNHEDGGGKGFYNPVSFVGLRIGYDF